MGHHKVALDKGVDEAAGQEPEGHEQRRARGLGGTGVHVDKDDRDDEDGREEPEEDLFHGNGLRQEPAGDFEAFGIVRVDCHLVFSLTFFY